MTLGRDANGNIEWNAEYDAFQRTVGFKTDLCKVAHPFTKGAVERLVRYVKENFLAARRFYNCNDLNRQALAWRVQKNQMVTKSRGVFGQDTLEKKIVRIPEENRQEEKLRTT